MKQQVRKYVDAATVPGVVIINGQPYGQAGGQSFPVTGVIRRGNSYIPVLDIPMMEEQPTRKAVEA